MARKSRRAFTLVELLVVIGIIATLIACLLPVLAGARQAANQIKCASNLRQFGVISAMYSAQNNGFIFAMKYDGSTTPPAGGSDLTQILDRYLPGSSSTASNISAANANVKFVRDAKIWTCPAAVLNVGSTGTVQLTYGWNKAIHINYGYSSGAPKYNLNRLSKLHRQTEQISAGDCNQPANGSTNFNNNGEYEYTDLGMSTGSNLLTNRPDAEKICSVAPLGPYWIYNQDGTQGYVPRYRHGRNQIANFVFMDGHVEGRRTSDVRMKNFASRY